MVGWRAEERIGEKSDVNEKKRWIQYEPDGVPTAPFTVLSTGCRPVGRADRVTIRVRL
jgi:hypothetical protein